MEAGYTRGAQPPDDPRGTVTERLTVRAPDPVAREWDAYRHGEDRPLGGYVVTLATYTALAGGLAAWTRRRGRLPGRTDYGQLAMFGVATHKLSRMIAKDPVTSPLRAFFTRFEGTSGPAELSEAVRGHGLKHAAGELLTCPFCLAQWIATGFVFGSALAPRMTRVAAEVMSAVALSDLLQFVYGRAERSSR